jgi:glutathione peroxidase
MLKITTTILLALVLTNSDIYNYTLPKSGGGTINLAAYQGKKILIVNTALNSKYTYQLMGLEQLYQTYKDSLVVIAVPSNSFGHEPNDDSTISAQLQGLFNISFPISAKIEVTGSGADSLYLWLTEKNQNGAMDNGTTDDFTKYLIDETGHLIGLFNSSVEPLDSELQNAIKGID